MEKDWIVKTTVYKVELEIVLQKRKYDMLLARYGEAFDMFEDRFESVEGAWKWLKL